MNALLTPSTAALLLLTSAVSAQDAIASGVFTDVLEQQLVDTDGDGHVELLLLRGSSPERPAAMVRCVLGADGAGFVPAGAIAIADPTHTLLAFADLLPTAGIELVAADPRGTACLRWPESTPAAAGSAVDAAVATTRIVLARGARFRERVDQPQLSPFVRDLNEDGELDLLLPGMRGVRPYLHDARDEDGVPQFRRMATIPVPIVVEADPGSTGLDGELVGSLRIPTLKTADLNGDGRPDLLTRAGQVYGYHLQNEAGEFAPPIRVDIGQFEDSTPKAAIELGSTAVIGDRQLLQDGDINGDGIPDYVIAHRRKIWTFLADARGPQFEKARTQAVADDVTALLLVDLDADERADLLTFRVQLPGVGELLLALVQGIDIDVRAVGYQSEVDGFARSPKWRRTVTLRVPSLLSLLSRQEELVERFTELVDRTRVAVRGSFAGNPDLDLAVATADATAVQIYADVGAAPELGSAAGQDMLRRLLFEDDDTIFDLERVFGLIAGLLDTLSERNVGDREPMTTVPLRDPATWQLLELLAGDAGRDENDELIAVYAAKTDVNRRVYDVLR